MPLSLLPAFLFYCFAASITPGPANLCSLATAMKYGTSQAMKQWRGLYSGFAVDALFAVLINYFLGAAASEYLSVFKYVGGIYILWMAFHMLKSSASDHTSSVGTPSFWTGFFLQLTNVKVIIYCLTALSAYVLPYNPSFPKLLAYGVFLTFTGPVANLAWIFLGASLQGIFRRWQKPLNAVMAASLALCAWGIMAH